jgi:hypothetical protein
LGVVVFDFVLCFFTAVSRNVVSGADCITYIRTAVVREASELPAFALFLSLSDCAVDMAFAKQQHMHDTLAEYGRAVVKEMRALAAERDASTTVQAAATTGTAKIAGGSGDDSTGEKDGVSNSNMNSARAVSGKREGDSEKKGTQTAGTNAKGKAKSKKQKSKVSHVVDKMLFNYRNIGTLCLVPVVHASDAR